MDLEKLVGEGESEVLEFKKTTSQLQRGAESLCAFLNGKGGRVLFGVTASGEIRGQEVSDKTLLDISQMLSKIEPAAPIDISREVLENGKEVIILTAHLVQVYQPFTFMGRPYQRVGSATRVMTRSCYQQLLLQNIHSSTRWEKGIAHGFTIKDLDTDQISRTCRLGVSVGRVPEDIPREPEEVLSRFGLMEAKTYLAGTFRRLGVLFCKC